MQTGIVLPNFEELLRRFSLLDIDPRNVVIVGSFVFYLLGLLKGMPHDIDALLVRNDRKFSDLRAQFSAHGHNINGFSGETIDIKTPGLPVEISKRWPMHGLSDEQILRRSLNIGGLNIWAPQDARRFMEEVHRQKDEERLALLDPHNFELKL